MLPIFDQPPAIIIPAEPKQLEQRARLSQKEFILPGDPRFILHEDAMIILGMVQKKGGGGPVTISSAGSLLENPGSTTYTSGSVSYGTDPGNGVSILCLQHLGGTGGNPNTFANVKIGTTTATQLTFTSVDESCGGIYIASGITASSGTISADLFGTVGEIHIYMYRKDGGTGSVTPSDSAQQNIAASGVQTITNMSCAAGGAMLATAGQRNTGNAFTSWSLGGTPVDLTNVRASSSNHENFATAQTNISITVTSDSNPGPFHAVAFDD